MRQQTWGVNPLGIPQLTSLGTGVQHTPIQRGLLGPSSGAPQQALAPSAPVTTQTTSMPSPGAPSGASGMPGAYASAGTAPALNQYGSTGTPPAQQGLLGRTLTPAYQTQQTTPSGQTVGGYGDARGSYYGGTDSSGKEMFFATPQEAAASLDRMDQLNGTNFGQMTRKVLDYANQHGVRPDVTKWNNTLGRSKVDIGVNKVIDGVTGLPFGMASTLINPQIIPADAEGNLLGQQFNAGGGGLTGLGGSLSYRNLNNIAAKQQAGEEGYQIFSGDSSLTDGGTPLGISPGLGGYGSVVSGNTSLAIQQNPGLDANGDGQLTATELIEYNEVMQAQKEAERLAHIAGEREAAEAEARRVAEENAAAAAAIAAEQQRRENKAKAQAEREAYEAAQRESGGGAYVGGTVVTDRHGNAVKDSSNNAVTSGGTWESGGGDDGGGDSGGGK